MKSLRYNKVIVITVIVALLSMAAGFVVLSKVKHQLVNASSDSYKQQQTLLANQIAETLSNNLVNIQNQLNVIATMPEVKNIDNVEQCNNKLTELLEINQKQLGNLGRVDTNGRFVCSVNKTIIGQDSAQYGSYINDLIKDPAHNPVIGRITRPAGADTFAAGLHVPVYENGVFKGTLGGAMYFSRFQDTYLRGIKFGNSGHVVVMDDNGDILYHPSKEQNGKNLLDPKVLGMFEPQQTMRELVEKVKTGQSGNFDYSVQGTKKIGLYKTFKIPNINRNWAVFVTIPVEDLDHAVNEAGINNIFRVLVGLFAITTALLTFISLRNIIKNIEVQRMKDDFISITSHQLRTPATIVKQNLGMIKEGYVKDKKDVDKFISSAYESNEDQLSIIENILSVSKFEAGRMELQKENIILQDVISKITGSMKISLAAKKHKLHVTMPDKPINLYADPTKLSMAIENLVSNAVKYTHPKGLIDVKVSTRKGTVYIIVKDNGKGISKDDMPQLFLRFNRLHSAINSHVPGTGLGLYLTKKIVELHGGDISVVSRESAGSMFTIKLPLD